MIPSPLPADLGCGILHLGLGAFHRAHQAAFTQDAIAAAGGNWGIEAVSMRNPALSDVLTERNGQYTLIERHPVGPKLLAMTVIRKALALPGNVAAVAARMADPDIRIVTITVTEKGYGADIGAARLNRDDANVAADLADPSGLPSSLVGLLCLGLAERRAAGLDGLTLMSCDNLPDNGHVLRAITLEFARDTDPALAEWIETTCRFPSSMVDRITPASTDATRMLAGGDPAAVETEPFRQWVIEDSFAGPRPAWEKAGALFVADVRPFENMKLRLLNGAHSFLAYAGALLGHEMVRDVMADPDLARAVRWHMTSAAHSLDPVPGFDVDAYIGDLIARFENPAMAHRCIQIAMDGSQKLPQRIFAPALELSRRGVSFASCALATAVWLRFLEGEDVNSRALPLNDPKADLLREALTGADEAGQDVVTRMGSRLGPVAAQLWARDGWQQAVRDFLQAIHADGVAPTIRRASAGSE